MYAAHSSAASAITAQVAAASQQLNSSRPGASSTHGQPGSNSSRGQERPQVHKEDFVDVEKSNMVMLVSGVTGVWWGW
jgi:hypothetical protein